MVTDLDGPTRLRNSVGFAETIGLSQNASAQTRNGLFGRVDEARLHKG
jgi:hypothetical protein